MSEEIAELGEIAYVGYFKASDGKSLISGAPLPAWDEQAPEIRQAWNLAAMAVVDRWREAGDEPEPAKVIVVTEASGRERRFDADSWDGSSGDGGLDVHRTSREEDPIVAHYAHGAWLSVREDGAEVPDATKRALGIAKAALREIDERANDGGEQPFGRPEIGTIAHDALEEIWTETEG